MRMSREVMPETAVARTEPRATDPAARIRFRPAGKAAPAAVGGASERLETTRPITVAAGPGSGQEDGFAVPWEDGLARGVAAPELLDAPGGIHDLLLPGVERVAGGADLDVKVALMRGACLERVAAGTGNREFFVPGMDVRFHGDGP